MRTDESSLLAVWKDPFRYLLEMLVIIFLCLPCWKLMWVVIHSGFGRAACSACVEFSLPPFKGCWAKRALPWVPALWWEGSSTVAYFLLLAPYRYEIFLWCNVRGWLPTQRAVRAPAPRCHLLGEAWTDLMQWHRAVSVVPSLLADNLLVNLTSSFQCILGQFASRVDPGSSSRACFRLRCPPCTPPLTGQGTRDLGSSTPSKSLTGRVIQDGIICHGSTTEPLPQLADSSMLSYHLVWSHSPVLARSGQGEQTCRASSTSSTAPQGLCGQPAAETQIM